MHHKAVDVLIIGGGVIGLSTALKIKERHAHKKILILEKELGVGLHASGRNSGVLHAGFYYSKDSLKAKMCSEGNKGIKEFAKSAGFPIQEIGKVVVTSSEDEEEILLRLFNRGISNNIELEIMPREKLGKYEPLARTFRNFIWSPTTAVANPKSYIQMLLQKVIAQGVEIQFDVKVSKYMEESIELEDGSIVSFSNLINCAGSQADRIAHIYNSGTNYIMVPFVGTYLGASDKTLKLSRLVYPVPNLLNPFLGAHFTINYEGMIKIGPTAIPGLGREQYKINERLPIKDISDTLKGLISMFSGENNLVQIAKIEMPKLINKTLIEQASSMVPDVKDVKSWKRLPPGIRAQLVDTLTGNLVQDFVVEKSGNKTHVLNAVSPGWTCSLSFGQYIADLALGA
jgi:L-2-hydroxyglutarate oxidase